jgi:hypothetical protein
MAKVTHTHRGHCQRCVRVQAIDPSTGLIAKHGYTVHWGQFNGTCPGSDNPTLHVERSLADHTIKMARKDAVELAALAECYRKRTKHPVMVGTNEYRRVPIGNGAYRSEEILAKWEDATEPQQRNGIRRAVLKLERDAELATAFANDLQTWADKITGKVDAYRVEDLEPMEWKVGDTVRVGGKKGYDAKIEAIEDMEYTTRGFTLRGGSTVTCPHARFTRPAVEGKQTKPDTYGYTYTIRESRPAKVIWEPLRNLKRQPTKLAEELKAAGKL